MIKQTHTFVDLALSPAAFDEIKEKLEQAGYHHVFMDLGKRINMAGIALVPEPVAVRWIRACKGCVSEGPDIEIKQDLPSKPCEMCGKKTPYVARVK